MCVLQIYRRALRFFRHPDIPPPDSGGGSSHSFTGFAASGGAGRYLEKCSAISVGRSLCHGTSARAADAACLAASRCACVASALASAASRSRSALFCDSISASPFSSRGLNLPKERCAGRKSSSVDDEPAVAGGVVDHAHRRPRVGGRRGERPPARAGAAAAGGAADAAAAGASAFHCAATASADTRLARLLLPCVSYELKPHDPRRYCWFAIAAGRAHFRAAAAATTTCSRLRRRTPARGRTDPTAIAAAK